MRIRRLDSTNPTRESVLAEPATLPRDDASDVILDSIKASDPVVDLLEKTSAWHNSEFLMAQVDRDVAQRKMAFHLEQKARFEGAAKSARSKT